MAAAAVTQPAPLFVRGQEIFPVLFTRVVLLVAKGADLKHHRSQPGQVPQVNCCGM